MSKDIHQKLERLLGEVLKNQNFETFNVEFPEFDSSGGYAAEIIFAKVTGEKDGSKKILDIIIKKSRDCTIVQETLNLREGYISEINMYSKFIPYLQKFARERNCKKFNEIPHCYGTISRENQYIVFLENLKLRGFNMHDIKKPLDLNHTKLVLRAYAKLHAQCLALNDQEPKIFEEFKECCNISSESAEKVLQCLVATTHKELESVIDIYEEKGNTLVVEKLKSLQENYENIFTDSLVSKDEDYLVIRHGDCWNNNYLFHYNEDGTTPDKVVVIDWQMGLFGSPLADITLFFFFCCSREELKHIEDLLKFYHEEVSTHLLELGSNPEQCFPWKICQDSFKRYAPIAIAGMPQAAKLSCQIQIDKTYDIADAAEEGNFCKWFEGELRDPEEYFNRIDGVLELCIEKGFI